MEFWVGVTLIVIIVDNITVNHRCDQHKKEIEILKKQVERLEWRR